MSRSDSAWDRAKRAGCCVCGRKPNDAHHIHEQHLGGPSVSWNLMPLCKNHHRQWHGSGAGAFLKKYPSSWDWMLKNNWYILDDEIRHDH